MIFAPENACLEWLTQENVISGYLFNERLIGSVSVSLKHNYKTYNNGKIKSSTARRFLRRIEDFKGTKRAQYDNKVYYLPYYRNYFSDLEKAYENTAKALSNDFMGFVVVVDNSARNEFIPVSRVIIDIWKNLGFKTKIEKKLTREMSHFGAINPRAKGFRAKHREFTIKIWKQ